MALTGSADLVGHEFDFVLGGEAAGPAPDRLMRVVLLLEHLRQLEQKQGIDRLS